MTPQQKVINFEQELLDLGDLVVAAEILPQGAEPFFYSPKPKSLDEAKAVIARLERDSITKMYVRGVFEEKFRSMIAHANANHLPVAYLQADLDHFKKVKDAYGDEVAARVIAHAAQVIYDNIRSKPTNHNIERRMGPIDGNIDLICTMHEEAVETVGREFRDKFGIALYGASSGNALNVAGRLRNALKTNPYLAKSGQIPITMSIGIATTETAATLKELYHGAEYALDAAKDEGRDRAISLQGIHEFILQKTGHHYSAGHHSPKKPYTSSAA
jgi:GGDEF domain-containing protein